MANKRTVARLDAYEHRYRELARHLADIGYVAAGSIASRHARCGKTNCACHADPPRLHGPYWHFTVKVNGKTVNRRLTPRQAELYRQWISNDRRAKELLAQMRQVAGKATELILADALEQEGRASPEPEATARRGTSRRTRAQ